MNKRANGTKNNIIYICIQALKHFFFGRQGAVYDIGEENTAFAQYFTGECYLKMLATEGILCMLRFVYKMDRRYGRDTDEWRDGCWDFIKGEICMKVDI